MFEPLSFPMKNKQIGLTTESEHFKGIDLSREVMIPLPPHPGAFGVTRRFHVHEGVDLYCNKHEPIYAMEAGVVVEVLKFTGPHAGSPWWLDTFAVMVEGAHGVINYGEILPAEKIEVGTPIAQGQLLGTVVTVLAVDKGRPRNMLHLELHQRGTRSVEPWDVGAEKAPHLLDPTYLLLEASNAFALPATGIALAKDPLQWDPLLQRLTNSWTEACLALGIQDQVSAHVMLEEVLRSYSEPFRGYHNVKHLYEMVCRVEKANSFVSDKAALIMSIFFHDKVYKPEARDNETKSAAEAVTWLQTVGVTDTRIQKVEGAILATAHHVSDSGDFDTEILLDLDMAILAANAERYEEYRQGIAREYFGFDSIRRIEALEGLLSREKLYYHPQLLEIDPIQATRNIQGEIAKLRDAISSRG